MQRLTCLFRLGLLSVMLLFWVLLVSGCAGMRVVDSQVLAIANLPPELKLQGASYRFERLPSQHDNPEAALAEQQAEQALSAVGMVRNDQQGRLSVLLGYQGVSYVSDAYRHGISSPYASPSRARSLAWGASFGVGLGMNMPPPVQYRREVSLIVRDLPSSRVVYETHAVHDGIWSDSATIFATLFKAALSNFPNPPAGVQRVTIEIPR